MRRIAGQWAVSEKTTLQEAVSHTRGNTTSGEFPEEANSVKEGAIMRIR
jgi:hypothetical protein